MNARLVRFALLLALLGAGCSRALTPTIPDRATSRGAGTAETFATTPSPPLPLPVEPGGPPTRVAGPRVLITSPLPSHLISAVVPPTFTLHWSAGAGPAPQQYRYRLFAENDPEFDFLTLLVRPDSVLRFYQPSFTGWTRVDGSIEQALLHDLTPHQRYVFVVLAFDNRSNYDPVLTFDTNMLFFNVSLPIAPEGGGTGGPGGGADAALDPTPRPRGH
jgi:hypothetical protein